MNIMVALRRLLNDLSKLESFDTAARLAEDLQS